MKVKRRSLDSLINTDPRSIIIGREISDEMSMLIAENGQIPVIYGQPGLDIKSCVEQRLEFIENTISNSGVLLFRGFSLKGGQEFQDVVKLLSNDLIDYSEPSTPRTKLTDKIYTSTDYPKEQIIPMHNEHSYSTHWPQKIWFYCDKPAISGGQTPIANSAKVFQLIDPAIREEFIKKGVLYKRNFYDEVDISWQNVFQTHDKSVVEKYCNTVGIKCTWKSDGNLQTEQVRPAVLLHPRTGQELWFNQAHLFHISNLDLDVQNFLIEQFGEANLPRSSYFGDGTEIPLSYLEQIRESYNRAQVTFDWKSSDILMLDNMLFSHGRNAFEGERKVMVAMAEPMSDNPVVTTKPSTVFNIRRSTAEYFINENQDSNDHNLIKYKLAAACRMLVAESLDEGGISGHITARVPGKPHLFWVNPFGMLAEEVTPDNLLMVDKHGTIIEGNYPLNVAGFCIHSALHSAYPDINCIVHTHSPWGTLFSSLGKELDILDQNCCLFFENHALYPQYNGPVNNENEAADLVKAIRGKDVLILQNHGTISCGSSVESALIRMVAIERAYRLNILALNLPKINLIPDDIASSTRDWIGNDLAFDIEFNALLRKVENRFPDLLEFKPKINKNYEG